MYKTKHNKNNYKNKGFKRSDRHQTNDISIKIEDILQYLQEKKEDTLKIANISAYFKINSKKDYNILYHKLSILVDLNLLHHQSDEVFTINKRKNFAIVYVHKEEENKQLLISYQSIFDNRDKDNVISYLHPHATKYNPIKAKKYSILSEVICDENDKILLLPLFYIQKNYINKSSLKAKEFEHAFVSISEHNKPVITPISFKSKEYIYIDDLPLDIENNSIIKIQLIKNNEAKYIETLVIFKDNQIDYNQITLCQFNIKHLFPDKVISEADQATNCSLENRKDIRHLPFVTIDAEDAKDFDDAIYAELVTDKKDSYDIYVAIADVSYYVAKDSELDKEAKLRANSIYLPGTVIPMLPLQLSNGWCSLKPNVERACLLATIRINRNGQIEDFKFERALMQSKARLTYKEVQDALNGSLTENIKPYIDNINSIYEAYKLLFKARQKRQALAIKSLEIKIDLDSQHNIKSIDISSQDTANEIVEEFMIAANIAAAKLIARYHMQDTRLAVYRIHEKPSIEKLQELQKVLSSLKIREKIPFNPEDINGEILNNILNKYKNDKVYISLNEAILRLQSPARYSNNNIGHFGLNLKEYCHFTSPIRRYSDLLIHRLILSLIDNQHNSFDYTEDEITQISKYISSVERQAFAIENISKNRYLAKWYQDKIDNIYEGYISTITNAGMFINLHNTQASGLLPSRLISTGYCIIDVEKKIIKDNITKKIYKLGDNIQVAIHESNPITGLITFKLIN